MELQFEKSAMRYLQSRTRSVQTQEQTQEVRLPDALPDIGRVLGAWGQPLIRSKHWHTGGMSVSGGVLAWVLYAPEDGSEPRCVDGWIPFQMDWDFSDDGQDGTISSQVLLRGVDARSVSARKLMLRADVSVLGEAYAPAELGVYAPSETPEDVQLLTAVYPVELPREAGEKVFTLDEVLELPASAPDMEKLIRWELQPELIDEKVMSDKVVFRGAAKLHIFYRTPDGDLASWNFDLPFSQYADLSDVYSEDAAVRVIPAVTSLELEAGENLRLKAGIVGQYVIHDRVTVQLVEDAYSPLRTVTPHMETLELPAILDRRRETLRLHADVTAASAAEVAVFLEQPRVQRTDGGVKVQVPAGIQALCETDTGAPAMVSARCEENVEIPADGACRVEAVCIPTGQPQLAGGGAAAEVLLELTTVAERGMPMVTALELGEAGEPDPGRPSLILCRAGEERLWDIAKRCGSTMDAIRKANHFSDDPAPDQILLIPVS